MNFRNFFSQLQYWKIKRYNKNWSKRITNEIGKLNLTIPRQYPIFYTSTLPPFPCYLLQPRNFLRVIKSLITIKERHVKAWEENGKPARKNRNYMIDEFPRLINYPSDIARACSSASIRFVIRILVPPADRWIFIFRMEATDTFFPSFLFPLSFLSLLLPLLLFRYSLDACATR